MLLKNKHIFIVEDNPSNLAVMRMILQKQGAQVPFDSWGDATLNTLKNYPMQIDMILLDIMLANNITGYDIIDEIRELPGLAEVPIVAVTASDPDSEMIKARDAGFNGYISKPINRFKFPKQLSTILSGQEVWIE